MGWKAWKDLECIRAQDNRLKTQLYLNAAYLAPLDLQTAPN